MHPIHRSSICLVLAASLMASLLSISAVPSSVSAKALGCKARIAAPTSATAGKLVTIIDKTAAPKGATLKSRSWFFGDGAATTGKSAGASVHHAYANPSKTTVKIYTITLLLDYSDGSVCTTTKKIEIFPKQQINGVSKLDASGSTIAMKILVPAPGPGDCGGEQATLSWSPSYGVEQNASNGMQTLILFGSAHLISRNQSETIPYTVRIIFMDGVAVLGEPAIGAVPYMIPKMQAAEHSGSCLASFTDEGFAHLSLFHGPGANSTVTSGTSKLKCKRNTKAAKMSCKYHPSKTLHVAGSLRIQKPGLPGYFFYQWKLKVKPPKKTCVYLGPKSPSPTAVPQPKWFKCPSG